MGNLARAIGAIGIVGGAIAHEDEIAAVRILAPAEIRNNAQYFRGTGSYHHVLGLPQATRRRRKSALPRRDCCSQVRRCAHHE
jgi:hypothetical protein